MIAIYIAASAREPDRVRRAQSMLFLALSSALVDSDLDALDAIAGLVQL